MRFQLAFAALSATLVFAATSALGQSEAREADTRVTEYRGNFVGAGGHRARGTVVLGRNGEHHELTFDEAFRADRGPDLYVVLSKTRRPRRDTDLYLGPITAFGGAQRYEIPAGTDLTEFRYVVIWCERFSVPFGQATLAADNGDGRDQ